MSFIKTPNKILKRSGESGKSTFLKQMKLMHNQITKDDYESVKTTIYANIMESMGIILINMIKMKIPFENSDREFDREAIFDVIENNEQGNRFTNDVFKGLKSLWHDEGVQSCYQYRNQYNLIDSVKYFFDDLWRIYESDYVPTTQDLLYARYQTTGIVRVQLPAIHKETGSKVTLRVFDVGGQRTERRKWLHCFDDVNCVIFITAISEFDKMMTEDSDIEAKIMKNRCNTSQIFSSRENLKIKLSIHTVHVLQTVTKHRK